MTSPTEPLDETTRDRVSPDVVAAAARGDELAWRELVEATYRDVYTLCLRILRNPDDAAEATQDAYVKAWRGLSRFRGDAAVETWLYRVATNAALSKLRSRRRRDVREIGSGDEMIALLPAADSVEEKADRRMDAAAIEAAMERLPQHYRDTVVLRDIYGLPIEEIAKQLGISQTAAKVRIHRARKMLKDMLFGGSDEVH